MLVCQQPNQQSHASVACTRAAAEGFLATSAGVWANIKVGEGGSEEKAVEVGREEAECIRTGERMAMYQLYWTTITKKADLKGSC